MKAFSVSAELDVIQRVVEGAALLVEVGRRGGVDGEDCAGLAVAVLALAACRLRDLGRTVRGTLDATLLSAPHNEPVGTAGSSQDVILGATQARSRRRRR